MELQINSVRINRVRPVQSLTEFDLCTELLVVKFCISTEIYFAQINYDDDEIDFVFSLK